MASPYHSLWRHNLQQGCYVPSLQPTIIFQTLIRNILPTIHYRPFHSKLLTIAHSRSPHPRRSLHPFRPTQQIHPHSRPTYTPMSKSHCHFDGRRYVFVFAIDSLVIEGWNWDFGGIIYSASNGRSNDTIPNPDRAAHQDYGIVEGMGESVVMLGVGSMDKYCIACLDDIYGRSSIYT